MIRIIIKSKVIFNFMAWEILKNLRKSQKKTQTDVANYLDTTYQTYAHYETGRHQPDPETLAKLADYFNVSVDYLLGRDTPENENKKIDEAISRIDRKFNKLNKEQQEQIENYLDFLLSQKK